MLTVDKADLIWGTFSFSVYLVGNRWMRRDKISTEHPATEKILPLWGRVGLITLRVIGG